MQNMNSNELSKLSPKILKEYIKAYNLPAKSAIEKDDLVRIIFNTRPISNESEKYYRRHKSKTAAITEDNNSGGSFSLSNMVQDLFTPPATSNNNRQQQQQRQQQQEQEQEQIRRQQQQQQQQQQQRQEFLRRQQQQQREEHNRRHQQQQQENLARMRQQHQASATPSQQQRTSTSTNTNRPNPRPSRPLSNENFLSLHDLVKTKIDPASLSVRTLKSILKVNYVEQSHVIEKSELVKLVIRLADQHRAEIEGSKKNDEGGGGGGGNEDLLCRICFDNQQNCVFLNCGHMVTCMECAKKVC
jgi:flagellar biosynthesis GTPase FlhF